MAAQSILVTGDSTSDHAFYLENRSHSEHGGKGIQGLQGFFGSELERRDSCTSEKNRKNLEQVMRMLDEAAQPTLFD